MKRLRFPEDYRPKAADRPPRALLDHPNWDRLMDLVLAEPKAKPETDDDDQDAA